MVIFIGCCCDESGAMPEIIHHGVNGFFANTEDKFAEYMQRVDEIDSYECRKSVERISRQT
jgi:hypothetical protein